MGQPQVMQPITIDHQLAEVRREIGLRKRVYPRWVKDGRMTQVAADEQIAAMEAVRSTLERVKIDNEAKKAPGLEL